jgi:hypothetical protein
MLLEKERGRRVVGASHINLLLLLLRTQLHLVVGTQLLRLWLSLQASSCHRPGTGRLQKHYRPVTCSLLAGLGRCLPWFGNIDVCLHLRLTAVAFAPACRAENVQGLVTLKLTGGESCLLLKYNRASFLVSSFSAKCRYRACQGVIWIRMVDFPFAEGENSPVGPKHDNLL